ncbi:unnamed protein product [Rotaria sp. Silwood2]|nr:unnamed protein product [Rotaria sp. Silwood2]CAF2930905.1 unnamed protein product [Rotaria sp. Silwood2]CAF3091597.1 unnamed protein product [Rotaria sp. Silwood2]CAF3410173.1 unnamed protein product [Rotaria sp. Silwood2]
MPGYALSRYYDMSNEANDLSSYEIQMKDGFDDEGMKTQKMLEDNPVDVNMERSSDDEDEFDIENFMDVSETTIDEHEYNLMKDNER